LVYYYAWYGQRWSRWSRWWIKVEGSGQQREREREGGDVAGVRRYPVK